METPKIELKEMVGITQNTDNLKEIAEIREMQDNLNKMISRYNHLLKLRQEIACCANEYMRISLNQLSDTETRHLLVKGCESEMEELVDRIEEAESHISGRLTNRTN